MGFHVSLRECSMLYREPTYKGFRVWGSGFVITWGYEYLFMKDYTPLG